MKGQGIDQSDMARKTSGTSAGADAPNRKVANGEAEELRESLPVAEEQVAHAGAEVGTDA